MFTDFTDTIQMKGIACTSSLQFRQFNLFRIVLIFLAFQLFASFLSLFISLYFVA